MSNPAEKKTTLTYSWKSCIINCRLWITKIQKPFSRFDLSFINFLILSKIHRKFKQNSKILKQNPIDISNIWFICYFFSFYGWTSNFKFKFIKFCLFVRIWRGLSMNDVTVLGKWEIPDTKSMENVWIRGGVNQ